MPNNSIKFECGEMTDEYFIDETGAPLKKGGPMATCWRCGDPAEIKIRNRDLCYSCADNLDEVQTGKSLKELEDELTMRCPKCGKDRDAKRMQDGPEKPCQYCRQAETVRKGRATTAPPAATPDDKAMTVDLRTPAGVKPSAFYRAVARILEGHGL